jgi:pimeloyl-ACP methyl ester carboxylesterase
MTAIIRPDATHWLKILSGDAVLDVAVHEWTVENPRTSAFCLHGFAGNAQDFALLAVQLKIRGIATFAVDMPGRGSSSFLGDPQRYTLRLQQLVLTEAMLLATTPMILVGTSWGGAVAGAMLPHLTQQIDGLVLVDTPMVSGHQSHYPYEDFLRDEAATSFTSLQSARTYYALTRKLQHLPDIQLDHLMGAAIMKSGGRFRLRYDLALADRIGRRAPFDLTQSIAKKPVPTLAVLGADSHLVKEPEQIAARSNVPALLEHICPHEAHPPSLSRPDDLRVITGFMSDLAST